MKTVKELIGALNNLKDYWYYGKMFGEIDGKQIMLPVFTNGEKYVAVSIQPEEGQFKVIAYEIEIDQEFIKYNMN